MAVLDDRDCGRRGAAPVSDALMGDTNIPLGIPVTVWERWRFRRRLFTGARSAWIAAVVQASCFFPGPYWQMVPLDGRATFDGAWPRACPSTTQPRWVRGK